MRTRKYYCSACDREIDVLVGEDGITLDVAATPVCLDHGARCTGELCPIFELPSEEMKAAAEAFRAAKPPGPQAH